MSGSFAMKASTWFLSWLGIGFLAPLIGSMGGEMGTSIGLIVGVIAFAVGLFGAFDIAAKRAGSVEGQHKEAMQKLQAGLDRQRQRRSDIESNRYRRSSPVSRPRWSFVGWAAYRVPGEDTKWLPGRLYLEGSSYYLVPDDLDPMDGLKGIELWIHDLRALHHGGSFSLDPGLVSPLIDDSGGDPVEVAVILDDEDGEPTMVEFAG